MKVRGNYEDPKVQTIVEQVRPLIEAMDQSPHTVHVFGLKKDGRPLVRLLVPQDTPYTERVTEMAGWLKGINVEVGEQEEGNELSIGLRRDLRENIEVCKGIVAYFACGVEHDVIPPGQEALTKLINSVRRLS